MDEKEGAEMGFRLRGGNPKNMGQGIYWVQRHLADQKRMAAAQRRVDRANEKAKAFNERFERIVQNFRHYHLAHKDQTMTITPKRLESLSGKIDGFEELREWINENIDTAGQTHLSRLSTLARSAISICAKIRKQDVHYDGSTKTLKIDDQFYRF